MNPSRMQQKAFTLIELLIVVAIIGILAAIAIPNFLEAQVRAKIARVKSDQRTLATALETYRVDNSAYPEELPLDESGFLTTISLRRLTTPVAYLTNLAAALDPFTNREAVHGGPGLEGGIPMTYANYEQFGVNRGISDITFSAWGLDSYGPDHALGPGTGLSGPYVAVMNPDFFAKGTGFGSAADLRDSIYDASNGTISGGDIYRVGGSIPGPAALIMNQ